MGMSCDCPFPPSNAVSLTCLDTTKLSLRVRVLSARKTKICAFPPCTPGGILDDVRIFKLRVIRVFKGRSKVGRIVLARSNLSDGMCGVKLDRGVHYHVGLEKQEENDLVMKNVWVIPTCKDPTKWTDVRKSLRIGLRRFAAGKKNEVCKSVPPTIIPSPEDR